MKEIWVPIAGYEDLYHVSNFGRVKSLHYNRTNVPRILSAKHNQGGYHFVTLSKNNKQRNRKIHILVAQAFIPNPDAKPQVNHIDGDKSNNRVENLEWVTASENVRHSFSALGRQSPNKGRCGGSHYASKQVYQYNLLGEFVKQWGCVSDAARALGCNPCQILNNVKGRNKTCHGYMWRYEYHSAIDTAPVTSRKTHKKTGLEYMGNRKG